MNLRCKSKKFLQGTIRPLVLGTNGATTKKFQMVHKLSAKEAASSIGTKYYEIMSTIRKQIDFSLLHPILLCIRGS